MSRRRVALVAVLAVVAALVAAALLIPLDSLRAPLEAAASRALGRDVRIGGAIHVALYPRLGMALHDVSIANAPGAHDPQLIAVGKLIVGADPQALLHGDLRITKVVLKQPVIHLEIAANGVANWQPASAPGAAAAPPPAAMNLRIDGIRVEDGTVTYADARSKESETLRAVSLTLTMPRDAGEHTLTLAGAATWNAVALKLDAGLDDVDAFAKGRPANAHIALSSQLFQTDFTGRVQTPGAATGTVKLSAASLRALAAWARHPLPPGNGFGATRLDGALTIKDAVYALSKATIALDGMKLTGDLSIDLKPARPLLNGSLSVDRLNVLPYLAPGASPDVSAAAAKATRDAPLALGSLTGFDADLWLTVGPIVVPGFKIDRAALAAELHGGVLKAQVNSIAAYGGVGKGALTVDATGAITGIQQSLEMSGVRTELLLADMAGMPHVRSTGSVRLDIATRGRTQAELFAAASGSGSVAFANGAISGVDLGLVARLVQSGGLFSSAEGASAATPFTTLTASFTIRNAVVQTGDLRMVGPSFHMAGAGWVNLVTRQIDFRLDPTAKLLGVAGVHLINIGVPFEAKGTLDNPTFEADAGDVAAGVAKGLVESGAKLPLKAIEVPGNILKSIFGGP